MLRRVQAVSQSTVAPRECAWQPPRAGETKQQRQNAQRQPARPSATPLERRGEQRTETRCVIRHPPSVCSHDVRLELPEYFLRVDIVAVVVAQVEVAVTFHAGGDDEVVRLVSPDSEPPGVQPQCRECRREQRGHEAHGEGTESPA